LNFKKKKKGMCLPCMSSIFKNISPKTFGPHCVYSMTQARVRPYSKITVN